MFEFAKIDNEMEFRMVLRENDWLRKFLMSYCFDEGFVFFDEKKVLSGMKIEKLKQGQHFKQQLIKHTNQKRIEMVGTPLHIQSFQYLIFVIDKMRNDVRKHYEILIPYLVQLDKEDVFYVIDVLMKEFKLNEMQLKILKGGI